MIVYVLFIDDLPEVLWNEEQQGWKKFLGKLPAGFELKKKKLINLDEAEI